MGRPRRRRGGVTIFTVFAARLLPAFLLGWEGNAPNGDDLPRFFVRHQQQYGGYACRQVEHVGALFRLEANLRHGRGNLRELVEAFRTIGESGDRAAIPALPRDLQFVEDLAPTWGEAYAEGERKWLAEALEERIHVPPVEDAFEGLVRFAAADPLNFLEGWCALTPEPGADADVPAIDDYSVDSVRVTDEAVLDEAMLGDLAGSGRRLGLAGPPRLFFLWESSD
ncbi:MAG TPA: hypothetical protein VMV18_01680 [bacterium]|nr:hypothetical protein [bacterium]